MKFAVIVHFLSKTQLPFFNLLHVRLIFCLNRNSMAKLMELLWFALTNLWWIIMKEIGFLIKLVLQKKSCM